MADLSIVSRGTKKAKASPASAAVPASALGQDLTLPGRPGVNNSSINGLQLQQDAANRSNDLRYSQGLNLLNKGYSDSMGSIEKAILDSASFGNTAKKKIDYQQQNDLGSDQQRATSRGLGNTTILNAMNDQSRRRANDATAQVDEQIANQRAGLRLQQGQLTSNTAGSIASFIAARNDQGPDASMYANLAAQAAAAPSGQKNVSTTVSPEFAASMAGGMSGQGNSIQATQAPSVASQTYFPPSISALYPPAQPASETPYLNPAMAAAQKGTAFANNNTGSTFLGNGGSVGAEQGTAITTPDGVSNGIPVTQRGGIIIKKSTSR